MGNFQTDRVIQILLPLFQGLSGQPVYQVDAYVLDAVFFAKPDCAQSLFAVMAPVQETEVFFTLKLCTPILIRLKGRLRREATYSGVISSGLASSVISVHELVPNKRSAASNIRSKSAC